MKHIKTYENFTDVHYNIFENIDTIIDDFRDILLELSDDRFNIQVKKGNHHAYSKKIEVIISKDGGNFDFWTKRNIGELTPFMFGEVKEYLLRILSYARSEGWNYFNFEVFTHLPIGGLVAIKGSSFNDGTQKASVEIKGDEIIYPYYDIENDKRAYKPIGDDVSVLCVYIGLGK
jgi:hypothetical protein